MPAGIHPLLRRTILARCSATTSADESVDTWYYLRDPPFNYDQCFLVNVLFNRRKDTLWSRSPEPGYHN